MTPPEERPRGILTPKDRALLLGHIEYEHQQQYSDRRRTIRERVANGILDFSTIQYLLPDRDRKRIFADPAEAADVQEAQFHESVKAMLYWTYLGLKEQNYDFSSLLSEAVEEAETDFARKYSGKSTDVTVQFDVDVTRSRDIDDIITVVEQGGPIQANHLYDLLELSGGVPIDTSELDTVSVWFQSAYPEGEKAVIETMFFEYLGVNVEVVDAEARAELSWGDFRGDKGPRRNAVTDSDYARPDPSEIKNYRSPTDYDVDVPEMENERSSGAEREKTETRGEEEESLLAQAIEESVEQSDPLPPSIHTLAEEQEDAESANEPITPESVIELLEKVREPFASTVEVAKASGCSPGAARQALTTLHKDGRVNRRSVIDTAGRGPIIWWLSEK